MGPFKCSILALSMIEAVCGHQLSQGPEITGISFVTKVRRTTTILKERDCPPPDPNAFGGVAGCLTIIDPATTTNPGPPKCTHFDLGPIEDGNNIEVGTGCDGFPPNEKITFTLTEKTTDVASTTFAV
ncbi:hypothetical protein F5B20DRAFT_594311 [Whalleya microplaca]|nr:hypothetical protein F5B20DRAFT_594311 [Whalleya microplaca]